MNDGVIFYKSHFEILKSLSNEEIGLIFRCCMTGDELPMAPHIKMAFNFVYSRIKKDAEEYALTCEKRRNAGRLGGAPKDNKNAQKTTNQYDSEKNKQNKQKVEKTSKTSKTSKYNIIKDNLSKCNVSKDNEEEINNTNPIIESGAISENNPCSAVAEPRTLEVRKNNFERSLIPYLEDYGKDMLREFADYWTEPDRAKKPKMRFEKEKTWSTPHRLSTWARREQEYSRRRPQTSRFQASQDSMQAFIDSLPKD